MRMFRSLGLALILTVGLGAAFRPSDNLPGREVGSAESGQILGGCPGTTTGIQCTAYVGCGTGTGTLPGGGAATTPTGNGCNTNCGIFNSSAVCAAG